MARGVNGRVLYFSLDPAGPDSAPLIERHRRRDGCALYPRAGQHGEILTLFDRRELGLLHAADIPATFGGRARMNVANALAAAAACIGLGIELACIRQGLRTFSATYAQAPGRLNLIETRHGRVLLDYCHNAHGLAALTEFVGQLAPGRTVAMLYIPGDRRGEDIAAFGALAARSFDRFVLTESADTRGRPRGAIAGLLHRALLEHGARPEAVTVETDEAAAIRLTLDRMGQDELAVLLVDHPAEAWPVIAGMVAASAPDRRALVLA